MAKKTPEINASSQADIAFLLLVFFLITTTMDVDKGLQRKLPPMPEENQQQDEVKINRRNIVVVKINAQDRIMVGSKPTDVSEIKDQIVEFLTNPNDDPNKPEKEVKFIKGLGNYAVSKGVVSLQNDKGTLYNTYIQVQNEIVRAINEIRDQFSTQHYGKKFAQLDEDHQKIVKEAVPQNISEAEPKDVKAKK
ncbi:MAG: biopolymer transporter ExbD [Bacteroidales bacterium]|nr:biopolymer transporter ExbD [Bacteroidales bacterium]MBP5228953.1 biopolymer transporter ExbD [Bacteroidales bacterium]